MSAAARETDSPAGFKMDAGKPLWGLLPFRAVLEIVKVLTWGHRVKGYPANNWQNVPDLRTRYFEAIMRHLTAWWEGEQNDPESGLSHLAHAGCCVLFLLWFELRTTVKPIEVHDIKPALVRRNCEPVSLASKL